MQFDLTSIDPTDGMKELLASVLRIDRAHINYHMEKLGEFDIEITINGRSMQPDVLIRTMLASKDRQIELLREQLQHNISGNTTRASTETTPVAAPVVETPAQNAVVTNSDAAVVVIGDKVVFKKTEFKKFYGSVFSGLDKAMSLVQMYAPDLDTGLAYRRNNEELMNRLGEIHMHVHAANKIIKDINNARF